MKRISIAVVALVACLAVAFVPAATAKKKKIKTFAATVTIGVQVNDTSTDPYQPTVGAGRFSGQVTSAGPKKCRSGRSVTIFRGGTAVTQVLTDPNGGYNVTVAARPTPGSYTATVVKRNVKVKNKKTKKAKKVRCAAGTSNAVPVA